MKKATPKTTPRATFQPADHLPLMLLSAMDGTQEYDAPHLSAYLDAARRILRSPHAFNGGTETITVSQYVLDRATLRSFGTHDRDTAHNRMVDRVLDGEEGEILTADSYDVLMLLHRVITEATLHGAAVMFELLKGGGR